MTDDAPPNGMDPALHAAAVAARGFMPTEEGDALFAAGVEAGRAVTGAPFLEIGSYCGKSSIWLGAAARAAGTVLFALDHHRGSEENQAGWEHHDPTLVDDESGQMDTMPTFRRTLARAGLEDQVVAVVGRSTTVSAHWRTPLSMLFIDGGHAEVHAQNDFTGWAPWLVRGGLLVIHDVFPDPADGGRPPYDVSHGELVSTAREFTRFARVLADGGRFEGRQVVSEEHIRLMTSDQVPAGAKTPDSFFPGFWDGSGWGFGVGVDDKGRYGWSGGLGTNFFVDSDGTIGVLLTQVEMVFTSVWVAPTIIEADESIRMFSCMVMPKLIVVVVEPVTGISAP